MGKWTPGPWGVGKWDDRCNGYEIKSGGLTVAVALYLGGTAPASDNARLIAKAPEMYELLKIIVAMAEYSDYWTTDHVEAENLIKEIDNGTR